MKSNSYRKFVFFFVFNFVFLIEFYFFFIGPIADEKLTALRPIADNITYIDWLSQEELADYIALSDLCLAGHFNASIKKACRTIPGKAYIYSAMGKAMILGDNAANHEIFEEDDRVSFVEMGNERALANEIMRRRDVVSAIRMSPLSW